MSKNFVNDNYIVVRIWKIVLKPDKLNMLVEFYMLRYVV